MTETPQSGIPQSGDAMPTPGSVNKDVPTEQWRNDLAAAAETPAAERHTVISDLLDALESQVNDL